MITGWEPPEELFAVLVRRVTEFTERVAAHRLRITQSGVTVDMSATGELTEVRFEPRLRNRTEPAQLAGLVMAAIRTAELAAARRRAEIAEELETTWRNS